MRDYLINTPVASIIFAFTIVTSIYTFSNHQLFGRFMLHPYSISKGRKLYTLLTSGLIHRDWGHLLFNMLTFYFFGFPLEMLLASLSTWGHVQFAVIYILGLVLSDVGTVVKERNNPVYYSLGASGAICAILFSFILFDPKMMLGVFFFIPMPAWIFGILFLGYCVWASRNARDSINHDAHFYGAVFGIILTILFYPGVIQHFIKQFTGA
ncbi:rhomboid family intramembrane serine protease [Parapedobacter sp. ISTM3]|uniref:Membrane associated serine protease, rhomboid family n=1 Tax=Parapedobacter luteus TaxID=623280 RepID=A0A1T5D277_9SPHI|nr:MULTISPECIES: rhomboid family intramembrane serine protease [Parapedobacter]MBK1440531.1 rhomboid family intramembrane serine protease [Parapedobacter sp. ISTM3]SKB65747.1 Membrane associated serine protease, rhomboid family [Parapedobacter luteus]